MKIPYQYFFTFFLVFHSVIVNAQKLPNVQKESFLAPANIRIDGKPTEWGNKLQAYNSATEIYYTMANDNDNLYFIVQATKNLIINKIMKGGVTLQIQPTEKNNTVDGISITYPAIERGQAAGFILDQGIALDTTPKIADSVMIANNQKLTKACKYIAIRSSKGVDTLSVYNEDNIKVSAAFNNRRVYTFELSIPLKRLNISLNDQAIFNYHVTLNATGKTTVKLTMPPGATPEMIAEGERLMGPVIANNLQLTTPTDFWGRYSLILK